MNSKIFLSTVAVVASAVVFTTGVSASYGSYGQYGGSPSIQAIIVDKQVAKPGSVTKGGQTVYVDNLSPSDMKYKPGETVSFKIEVKNVSTAIVPNVTLVDNMPPYLTYVQGPGTYDATNHTLTISLGDMNPQEAKVVYFTAKLADQAAYPADKGIVCMINKASAWSKDHGSDEDTAQLCIEKQVLGVVNVPKTGPEMLIFGAAAQIGLLGAGLMLKKKMG